MYCQLGRGDGCLCVCVCVCIIRVWSIKALCLKLRKKTTRPTLSDTVYQANHRDHQKNRSPPFIDYLLANKTCQEKRSECL
jgi:hypothetical protein